MIGFDCEWTLDVDVTNTDGISISETLTDVEGTCSEGVIKTDVVDISESLTKVGDIDAKADVD